MKVLYKDDKDMTQEHLPNKILQCKDKKGNLTSAKIKMKIRDSAKAKS